MLTCGTEGAEGGQDSQKNSPSPDGAGAGAPETNSDKGRNPSAERRRERQASFEKVASATETNLPRQRAPSCAHPTKAITNRDK